MTETNQETQEKEPPKPDFLPPPPKPDAIFRQARQRIFYQDDVLKKLSAIFYYHLEAKRRYHNNYENEKWDDWFQKMNKALNITMPETDNTRKQLYLPEFYNPPIFLTGKTGSGKTHTIKQLCKMFDINFVAINSTTISNAGYKGITLADIGAELLQNANYNTHQAKFSVVFFDEFDKLFLSKDTTLGIYHLSLVSEILTIIEGTTPFPIKDSDGLDSSRMLFFLGGSFNMHQAKENQPIGFTGEKTLKDTPNSQLHLTKFGLPDELAGRIGQILAMQSLTDEQILEILLKSPTSPFVSFKNQLAMVDCTVELSEGVLESLLINHEKSIEKFGVRGLYQAFYQLPEISDILMDAPHHPHSHYTITLDGYKCETPPTVNNYPTDKMNTEDDLPF